MIESWNARDPESLGEEEMKSIRKTRIDGPLVNYKQKGNRIEFAGMDHPKARIRSS